VGSVLDAHFGKSLVRHAIYPDFNRKQSRMTSRRVYQSSGRAKTAERREGCGCNGLLSK
jgi:hypothetical protein